MVNPQKEAGSTNRQSRQEKQLLQPFAMIIKAQTYTIRVSIITLHHMNTRC